LKLGGKFLFFHENSNSRAHARCMHSNFSNEKNSNSRVRANCMHACACMHAESFEFSKRIRIHVHVACMHACTCASHFPYFIIKTSRVSASKSMQGVARVAMHEMKPGNFSDIHFGGYRCPRRGAKNPRVLWSQLLPWFTCFG